jgi:hypothetical protein
MDDQYEKRYNVLYQQHYHTLLLLTNQIMKVYQHATFPFYEGPVLLMKWHENIINA